MISIVVPIHNCWDHTQTFLNSLCSSDEKPDELIVINNASTDKSESIVREYEDKLPLYYIPNQINIGVNPSWMQGYDYSLCDIVGFWNNDIIISPFLITMINKVFKEYPDVGLVVPDVINQPFLVRNAVAPTHISLEDMEMREGWCFTMRRKIIQEQGKIPSTLINSAGDDYLFNITKEAGYRCVRMNGVPIQHHGSATVRSIGGWEELNKNMSPNDEKEWEKIKELRGW
jgi:GT2 family glycosyltransferase